MNLKTVVSYASKIVCKIKIINNPYNLVVPIRVGGLVINTILSLRPLRALWFKFWSWGGEYDFPLLTYEVKILSLIIRSNRGYINFIQEFGKFEI